jgi:hypothetical protein
VSAAEVLSDLRAAGIELRVEGARLRFRPATISAETRALLVAHEKEIISLIERPARGTPALRAEDEALLAAVDQMDRVDAAPRLAVATCPACRGDEFWASRWRERICRRCHPPAPGVEVGHA